MFLSWNSYETDSTIKKKGTSSALVELIKCEEAARSRVFDCVDTEYREIWWTKIRYPKMQRGNSTVQR